MSDDTIAEQIVTEAMEPQESPESDSQTSAAEQPEAVSIEISHVLSTVLQGMQIPVEFAGHASGWQIIPITEDDGSKSLAVVLSLTRGNGLDLYWFRAKDLEVFIQQAIMTHQQQLRGIQNLNPLMVANKSQMQQAIGQHEAAHRLIVPGR
jgi:hypothetical protein